MPPVFLNGRFLERDDARVSAFDAGFQHGVGLFETMLGGVGEAGGGGAGDGGGAWVFRLDDHLERIAASARALGLSEALRTGPLGEAVLETLRRSGLAPGSRARARLTVTGGDLNLLTGSGAGGGKAGGGGGADPTILIVVQPATEYPAEMFERGVGVVIADASANPLMPFEGHKTLNYWWRLRELQKAAAKRAGEAIVLQVTNHLCGGCVSSVFLVKDGGLLTPIARGEEAEEGIGAPGRRGIDEEADTGGAGAGPALPSPVLPGVTRGWAIEEAARRGMGVTRRMLSISDLLGADEVFLTNSSWGVLPVVRVEKEAIGDGVVGRVTGALRAAWLTAVEEGRPEA